MMWLSSLLYGRSHSYTEGDHCVFSLSLMQSVEAIAAANVLNRGHPVLTLDFLPRDCRSFID